MHIIGFTGSRDGMTQEQIDKIRECLSVRRNEHTELAVMHGDCIGADAVFHEICEVFFPTIWIIICPANIPSMRAWKTGDEIRNPKPPLARNEDIAFECNELFATPKTSKEQLRSGTWSTIRYARKLGREVTIIPQ